jgi:hypothetical protein
MKMTTNLDYRDNAPKYTKTARAMLIRQWMQCGVFMALLFGTICLYEYRLSQIDTKYQECLPECIIIN